MAFGIECGDGWYTAIDTLCECLSSLYSTWISTGDDSFELDAPIVVADQIQEKHAGLRFYYHIELTENARAIYEKYKDNPEFMKKYTEASLGYTRYIAGAIAMAKTICSRTCEDTGREGVLHVSEGGWCRILNTKFAQTEQHYINQGYKPL
jgi:hypothetical protein